MEDNSTEHNTYKKLADQWLNKVLCPRIRCWQTVFVSEIANFLNQKNDMHQLKKRHCKLELEAKK